MTDYREQYIKRMKKSGANKHDRALKLKTRDFENYFKNSLNKESCFINSMEAMAIFQDHSQSNNKDLSDDKYVILPNSTECSIGDYITWRDQHWLVFTEEVKTIPTHQQLKIKVVNENLKWIKDGKICNNGDGWGAYVQNQTLYTLGVATSGNHIQVINAKMMMYMQNNEETRKLKIQDRIFIGHNVYQIMFADTVSRKGLINFLLEEDTMGANDNIELRIADYYGSKCDDSEKDDKDEDKDSPKEVSLKGEKSPKVGKTYVYEIEDGYEVEEWGVTCLDHPDVAYIMERNNKTLHIRIKNDNRMIGSLANVVAKVKDVGYVNYPIKIIKRY